ncbi:MAG TPA: hypothetical protein PLJ21_12275 [Pseudobdellovibrionaceae bacterium]|nr:hypothetical protein [Pseudobdellovibrionaceae bacterium]
MYHKFRKWIFIALIGCGLYIAGYYFGKKLKYKQALKNHTAQEKQEKHENQ